MASKYWLKLFHETIYDPKIMMRSAGARLRWYECLCLAGDYDHDGELPPIENMIFVFRISQEQLLDELTELVRAGLVTEADGRYHVRNWNKRQGQMPDAERKYRDRDTKQKQEYYNVSEQRTKGVRNSDADIDIDIELDIELDKELELDSKFDTILTSVQTLTGTLQTQLDYPAIKEMVELGVIESDIRGAVAYLTAKGYKIRGARSLINAVKVEREKRIQKSTASQFQDDEVVDMKGYTDATIYK
jgi:hypothetical protein